MGFWSSVCSFASSAWSGACSVVSSIGGALSSFATTVGSVIASSVSVVANVVQSVAQGLGLIKPTEKIEDLGDRALQASAEGIYPEKYEKFEEYVARIREFPLDPERTKMRSSDEKMLAGIGVISKMIEDKYNMREGAAGQLFALTALNPGYFDAPRLEKWIHTGQDIGKIVDYFDNKLGASDSFKLEQGLIRAERQVSGKSEALIEKEIEQAKTDIYTAARKLEQ